MALAPFVVMVAGSDTSGAAGLQEVITALTISIAKKLKRLFMGKN
jgi:hydroxymethylpyrimidine/phosphomethylpyrimidine kinase